MFKPSRNFPLKDSLIQSLQFISRVRQVGFYKWTDFGNDFEADEIFTKIEMQHFISVTLDNPLISPRNIINGTTF